jgi:hypothetical protein
VQKANKPTKVLLVKGEPQKNKKIRWILTLNCKILKFWETYIFSNIDEVDLILGDTFLEANTIDKTGKIAQLVVCRIGKEVITKLNRKPKAMDGKLNLVSLEQLDHDWFVGVMRVRKVEGDKAKANKGKLLLRALRKC